MKVFAFTPWYLPVLGGIEILINSLAKPLREQGIDISVVTDDMGRLPPREVIEGTPVHRLGFTNAIRSGRPGEPLKILGQLQQLLDEESPDILHMHCVTGPSAWYVDRLLKSSRFRGRFLVTQHGVLEPIDRMPVIRGLLQRADAISAVSEAALRSAVEFSASEKNWGVIPNGIEEVPAERIDGAPFRLLCVGRLQREKGFDLAIRALAEVRARGIDAVLTIVGEGEERQAFARLSGELGLLNFVHFLGRLDNRATRRLVGQAHLVLVPSRTREGFSLVAAEAAMAGVTAIVARVGGLPETVLDGETGIVVSPDDPIELGAAISRMLEDEGSRSRLGHCARLRAMKEYGVAPCAARYLAFYRSQSRSSIDQEPSNHVLSNPSQPCFA